MVSYGFYVAVMIWLSDVVLCNTWWYLSGLLVHCIDWVIWKWVVVYLQQVHISVRGGVWSFGGGACERGSLVVEFRILRFLDLPNLMTVSV